MNAAALQLEQEGYRRRTQVCMTASTVGHALVMLWIALVPHSASQFPALTEITLIEPGALAGAPAQAATPAPATYARSGAASSHATDESFRRLATGSELTPEPESPTTFADRITSRLASLQQNEPTPVRGVSSSALTTVWGPPSATGRVAGGGGTSPLALNRGGGGTTAGPALALNRGGGSGAGPAIVATGLPAERAASAPARGGETIARRIPAGAMLAGPIADRPVIAYTRPIYPEWAKRDAVEGSVTLYFVVRPDGGIKENVLVQKTAGFEDFDESARTALRAWRFAPLREGRTGEQWGTITFHFRLREAG